MLPRVRVSKIMLKPKKFDSPDEFASLNVIIYKKYYIMIILREYYAQYDYLNIIE